MTRVDTICVDLWIEKHWDFSKKMLKKEKKLRIVLQYKNQGFTWRFRNYDSSLKKGGKRGKKLQRRKNNSHLLFEIWFNNGCALRWSGRNSLLPNNNGIFIFLHLQSCRKFSNNLNFKFLYLVPYELKKWVVNCEI